MREGWEYKKLGEVCASKNTIIKAQKHFAPDDEISYIDISSINNASQKIEHLSNYLMSDAPSRAQQKVEKGDILISTVRPNLKNIAVVEQDATNTVASSGFCVLRPSKMVVRNYLFHYINSLQFTNYLISVATGANYPAVRDEDIRKYVIPLPPQSVQVNIVSELDKINELIKLKREQLRDLDNMAQSLFYEMFGDPVENEKGWEVKKLGDVCNIVRGGSPRPIEQFLGGVIPWIKIGDATKGNDIYIDSTKEHIIEQGLSKTRMIPKGSLIFANCGVSLGFARIINFDGCIHDGWLAFQNVDQNKLTTVFLLKSLNMCTEYFRGLAPEGTQPNLNTNIMKRFVQILPPLPLQQQFADRIELIEKQKAEVNTMIKDLEQLLASRMQYWFE